MSSIAARVPILGTAAIAAVVIAQKNQYNDKQQPGAAGLATEQVSQAHGSYPPF